MQTGLHRVRDAKAMVRTCSRRNLPEDVTVDRLGEMYDQQCEHMSAYGIEGEPVDQHWLGSRKTQALLRENAGYIVEELYEAINLLKNKPWKKAFEPVDREAFLEELADVWHFFLQLHIVAGIVPQEIYTAYFRKSLINENRRAEGY